MKDETISTMLLDLTECQLVLVDYQERLVPAITEGAAAQANALRLAQAANLLDVPVWGTEQNPSKLGPNAAELRALCRQTLPKMAFSGVHEGLLDVLRPPAQPPAGNARSLPRHLQKARAAESVRNSIVLGGCETHICLLQTALELLEEEFDVWVVTDACSSRALSNRDAAFDRLASAGAELVSTEMVLFEWLRTAAHPAFRQVQALIK